jgi:DNA polymerase-3 subunit gamma/tau
MPEPLEERLSRLTPDATGLDRDALLFAAGRASVRPARRWQAAAGLLAASQLVTLALFWPRPAPPSPMPVPAPVAERPVIVKPPEPEPQPPPDPSELGVLRAYMLSDKGDLPAPAPIENLVPDPPPLRAFGAALVAMPN